MSNNLNRFNITEHAMLKILRTVSFKMQKVKKELIDLYELSFSNKNLSEIIGKIMEKTCSDVFTEELNYPVKRALADKDPDLFFTKINAAIEIKMTSTLTAWTGGEFSKRPFEYLLFSWGENFDEFFCCLVHLEKEDWVSNYQKNFYGPSLKARAVYDKKEKIVFFGGFEQTKKGSIKIKREKITS